MKTKADLRKLILSSMTVIDPEENPSGEQAKALDVYIDGARGTLLELGLCWWDEDAIPDAVLVHLSRYVRAQCCSDFGRTGKGYESYEDVAIRRLSALKPPAQRETVPAEYF